MLDSTDRAIFFKVLEQDVHGSATTLNAPDKKMLTRTDENKRNWDKIFYVNGNIRDCKHAESYLSVVNKKYRVVENKEILLPLQEQMVKYFDPEIVKNIKIKDTILHNGAICWAEYVFPNLVEAIETKTGHKTSFQLRYIAKNTFNGSGAVVLYSGDFDVFCTNGMISGSYDVTKKRHTKNFNVEGFMNIFDSSLEKHKEQVEKYQVWADTQLKERTTEKVKKLFRKLTDTPDDPKKSNTLSDRLFNQFMIEREIRGDNIFAVSSALTAYSSHDSSKFPLTKVGNENTLLKRQEKVGKWLSSKVWEDFLEAA
jgi:hypothetical protein